MNAITIMSYLELSEADLAAMLKSTPAEVTETAEDMYRLLYALVHPETVEGWNDDPDTVPGAAHVSEWQDERNSRAEPY